MLRYSHLAMILNGVIVEALKNYGTRQNTQHDEKQLNPALWLSQILDICSAVFFIAIELNLQFKFENIQLCLYYSDN
jgi:hypothetical protein